jgi:hypothetical protein
MPPLRLLPELESALTRLPGVRAVSVVTDAAAAPVEVHVLALPGKSVKQLVRDVQSLALAELGIAIDHRTVSVVQVEVEPSAPRGDAAARVVLESVAVPTRASGYDAAVTLLRQARRLQGVADGPAEGSQQQWLVARATLGAVSELLDVPHRLRHAEVTLVGEHRVALVVAAQLRPEHAEHLVVGAALVRTDEPDAVARAVLDAVNRRLPGTDRS